MKKILFATSALVASAGVAAADLTWSGSGRLGMVYDEGATQETHLDNRFRLTVNGITETDSGVKFEARIRFETTDVLGDDIDSTGATVTGSENGQTAGYIGSAGFAVTAGGLRVDVGNVSDVFDSGDVINWGGYGVGYTGFLDQAAAFGGFDKNGFGASANRSQVIKARYTMGDFTGAVSYKLEDTATAGDAGWQIGVGYNFGAHSVGAMYGDEDLSGGQWAIGANGAFGDFSYAVLVGDNDTNNDVSYGLSGSYAISAATSLSAFYSDGGNVTDGAYGIGVSHSLGGGVTLGAGFGSNTSGNSVADAGVTFNF